MKISKDEWADIINMPVGMSKKVYKEMVKEMDIIWSMRAISTTPCFKCNMKSLNLTLNINFEVFFCRKEKKMEPIQHMK